MTDQDRPVLFRSGESRFGQIALGTASTLAVAAAWQFVPHPLVAAAAGFAPVAALIALRIPFQLCLAFIIFSFFRIHEAFPFLLPLKLPLALAASTLTALLWHTLGTRKIRTFWPNELNLFAVFFVLVTIGTMLAINRPMATGYWKDTYVKIAIMVFAIIWLVRKPEQFNLTMRAIVIAGSCIACVALYNKANGIGLVEGTRVTIGREYRSILGDPNDLSLVLLFPASFAMALLMTAGVGRFNRMLGLIGIVLVISAIIATQSRGGLLGSMTVLGLFGQKRIKSKVVLGAIAGVALLGLFAVAGISDRTSGGAGEDGIDESAMGRIHAWGAAWQMALSRPLNGVGLNNFVANYYLYTAHWDGKNHAVHSTWFGVLGETGFPGLIVFVSMVGTTTFAAFRTSNRLDKRDVEPIAQAMGGATMAGLSAFIVSGTFLTQGFTWPIYILLALTIAIGRYERETT
jgi:probable O-glycosylation ligase (exosortase A-associated)